MQNDPILSAAAIMLPDYENVVFVGDGARLCHSKLGYEIAPAGQLYQRGSSVAFAAEKSRVEGGQLVTMEQFKKKL